jgi:hypothetical protein
MELIDVIEEISDEVTIKAVAEARKEYKSGNAGIHARLAFKKHKETSK